MYDLNKEINTFYDEYVKLPKAEVDRLKEIKTLNIERLKNGLKRYNADNNTDYKLAENMTQGSVSMETVTQNEDNEYDIDVAIVFDKDNLPSGTTATKNMVIAALKTQMSAFKKEPEFLTNCIRVTYSEGYHIDFAVYRRELNGNGEYIYQHCGSAWRNRDPKAITKWFLDSDSEKNNNLRKAVRLLKMFCKSRSHWEMPGGLVQSVLCDEKYTHYERLDEMFYHLIVGIRDRLNFNKEVRNPTDFTLSLLLNDGDKIKVDNLNNRLDSYISKLSILFDGNCTKSEGLEAWNELFNHEYWDNQLNEYSASASLRENYVADNEQFIEAEFKVTTTKVVRIDCTVQAKDSQSVRSLRNMLSKGERIKKGSSLKFSIELNNVSKPYDVYWKVKNQGVEALKNKCLRGEITKSTDLSGDRTETASYTGSHYVECYIIKDGVCLAKDHLDVVVGY